VPDAHRHGDLCAGTQVVGRGIRMGATREAGVAHVND
jgi:hypothetical protein